MLDAAHAKLWDNTLTILKQWEHLGAFKSEQGSVAIGHVPSVARLYYMHKIYAPLNAPRLWDMEGSIGKKLSPIMHSFYQTANGVRLFDDIDCYGYAFDRDKIGQPISIGYGNVIEVPKNLPKAAVVIGSLGMTNPERFGYLVVLSNDKIVLMPNRCNYRVIEEWDNIFEMIYSEVKRIAPFYNEDGICENTDLYSRS